MKLHFLLAGLILLTRAAWGAPADAATEFHDPFATESVPSQPQIKVSDPLEPVNRAFFRFNDKLYCWILRPVGKGYRVVAPTPVREGIGRMFDNVKFPVRFVNNLLEGRFGGAGIETARFAVNTTVGIAGFFDPATRWKLPAHPADFDQTLAIYRIPPGIYLDWPFMGPSSVRGTVGLAGDTVLTPTWYIKNIWVSGGVAGLKGVNAVSLHLEDYDTFLKGTLDPYVAMRSAYFEHRAGAVKK